MNVEYMYAFTFGRGDKAVLIFRFDDVEAAIGALKAKGLSLVSSLDMLDRKA